MTSAEPGLQERDWRLNLWDEQGFGVSVTPSGVEFFEDPDEVDCLQVEIEQFVEGEGTFSDGHQMPVHCELNIHDQLGNQIVITSQTNRTVEMLFDQMANKITLTGTFARVHRWR